MVECRAGRMYEVDFDAARIQVRLQFAKKIRGKLLRMKCGMNQIDAENSECFLLPQIRAIEHVDVNHQVVRLPTGNYLKP